jgi:hypothetical protein
MFYKSINSGFGRSKLYLFSIVIRVSDPDPDWIRIQSGQWIRIQNSDPDPGGQKMSHKKGENLEISCFEVLDVLF